MAIIEAMTMAVTKSANSSLPAPARVKWARWPSRKACAQLRMAGLDRARDGSSTLEQVLLDHRRALKFALRNHVQLRLGRQPRRRLRFPFRHERRQSRVGRAKKPRQRGQPRRCDATPLLKRCERRANRNRRGLVGRGVGRGWLRKTAGCPAAWVSPRRRATNALQQLLELVHGGLLLRRWFGLRLGQGNVFCQMLFGVRDAVGGCLASRLLIVLSNRDSQPAGGHSENPNSPAASGCPTNLRAPPDPPRHELTLFVRARDWSCLSTYCITSHVFVFRLAKGVTIHDAEDFFRGTGRGFVRASAAPNSSARRQLMHLPGLAGRNGRRQRRRQQPGLARNAGSLRR